MSFKETGSMAVARILVNMDFKNGFPVDIGIDTPKGRIIQIFDYEGIPFRCHRCHQVGHMVASCPKAPRIYPAIIMEEAMSPPLNDVAVPDAPVLSVSSEVPIVVAAVTTEAPIHDVLH